MTGFRNALLGAAGVSTGGYSVDNSIVLDDGSSQYLSWTPSGAGDSTTAYTVSLWFRPGNLTGAERRLFEAGTGSTQFERIYINASEQLAWNLRVSGSDKIVKVTNQVFRDPHSWYHLVAKRTATTAVFYVNGDEVTSLASSTDPASDAGKFGTALAHTVGRTSYSASEYYDGSLSQFVYIDGSSLDPTSFGEYDTNGVWRPVDVSGLAFGSNGFWLDFEASGDLGNDVSGNANDFTPSGSPTQSSDTPTNIHMTFTPLASESGNTLSEGNTKLTTSVNGYINGSMAFNTGKWYWEITKSGAATSWKIGVQDQAQGLVSTGGANTSVMYEQDGDKVVNGTTSSYGASWTTEVMGVALNCDDGEVTFYKAGVSQGTITGLDTAVMWTLAVQRDGGTPLELTLNNGSGTSGFTYTPPTGYVAVNSANLYANAAPAIEDGTAYFQGTTYTGNGSDGHEINQSGNSTFQPDLLWVKSRNAGSSHCLFDAVRGASERVFSNLTNAEATSTEYLASFDADGFTMNDNSPIGVGDTNANTTNYVGWQWKGDGTSGSSNTDGSITSTVNVNDTAGFSIVSYISTNGSGAGTIGHGLNSTPEFIICKSRSSSYSWAVYHKDLTSAGYKLILDQTNAETSDTTTWNNTAPTSTVFSVGTDNGTNPQGSADNMIAYCFRSIPGYSAFGSYESNASTDGPLILMDFSPAFIMIKSVDTAESWWMIDNQRNTYNSDPGTAGIQADDAALETTSFTPPLFDFLSNGFKIRRNAGSVNTPVNTTYIYAAFAEHPFAGSSPATAR